MASGERTEEGPGSGVGETAAGLRATLSRTVAAVSQRHASLQRQHVAYAVLADMLQEVREHQPSLLARQAAYSLLYAVPSILITLVSLAAILDKNTGAGVSDALLTFVAEQAPAELRPLLDSLVQYAIVETSQQTAMVAVVISLAIAIWGGAGGVGALVYAINQVYDIRDTRSFVQSTALRLGLMLLGGIMVIGAFVLLAFGRRIGGWLVTRIGRGSSLVDFLSSGPVWALLLLLGALLLLYWLGPDIAKSFRWILPGAIAATLAIVATFALLELLLTFSNPGTAYGIAGSVLILLWALYLVSQIVVVGGVVNAVLGRRYDRTLRQALRDNPQQQLGHREIAVTVYR